MTAITGSTDYVLTIQRTHRLVRAHPEAFLEAGRWLDREYSVRAVKERQVREKKCVGPRGSKYGTLNSIQPQNRRFACLSAAVTDMGQSPPEVAPWSLVTRRPSVWAARVLLLVALVTDSRAHEYLIHVTGFAVDEWFNARNSDLSRCLQTFEHITDALDPWVRLVPMALEAMNQEIERQSGIAAHVSREANLILLDHGYTAREIISENLPFSCLTDALKWHRALGDQPCEARQLPEWERDHEILPAGDWVDAIQSVLPYWWPELIQAMQDWWAAQGRASSILDALSNDSSLVGEVEALCKKDDEASDTRSDFSVLKHFLLHMLAACPWLGKVWPAAGNANRLRDTTESDQPTAWLNTLDKDDLAILRYLNRAPSLRKKFTEILPDDGPRDRGTISKRVHKMSEMKPPLVDYKKGRGACILPAGTKTLSQCSA